MSRFKSLNFSGFLAAISNKRGLIFGMIIFSALIAFEIFNYTTTQFALYDVLGDLKFMGILWATILAIAFCGIDFAGIARIFTPEQGHDEPAEVWYLFGAWLLAAAMNATLTWWGVSVAIESRQAMGSAVISSETMTKIAPIFVALLVWVIRVLIISTFSIAGDRLFTQSEDRSTGYYRKPQPQPQTQTAYTRTVNPSVASPARPATGMSASASTQNRSSSLPPLVPARSPTHQSAQGNASRPAPKPEPAYQDSPLEPTYHSLGGVSASPQNNQAVRR